MKGLTNLTKLAKMTAQMKKQDQMMIFIGTVTALNTTPDGSYDFTCTVRGETDRSVQNLIDNDSDTVDSTMLYPNVSFMAGIDDGLFMIPKVGSQVVVCRSLYHQPFIIQMSGVEAWSMTAINTHGETNEMYIDKDKILLSYGGWNTPNKATSLYVSENGFDVTNQQSGAIKSNLNVDPTKITATVNNGSTAGGQLDIDTTKISIIGGNGGEVLCDNKVAIKNATGTLKTPMDDIMTYLTTINSALAGLLGGTPPVPPPSIAATQLKIDSLLN